jgi:hypothetical protein
MKKTDQWLGTHNLTTTRSPTRDYFPEGRYPGRLRIHRPTTNQVVDGKFDRFFWCDTLKKRVCYDVPITNKPVLTISCGPRPR